MLLSGMCNVEGGETRGVSPPRRRPDSEYPCYNEHRFVLCAASEEGQGDSRTRGAVPSTQCSCGGRAVLCDLRTDGGNKTACRDVVMG